MWGRNSLEIGRKARCVVIRDDVEQPELPEQTVNSLAEWRDCRAIGKRSGYSYEKASNR